MISIMVHGEPRSLLLSNWSSPPLLLGPLRCPLTNGAKTQLGLECSLLPPSSILLLPAPDRHLSRAREMRSGRGEEESSLRKGISAVLHAPRRDEDQSGINEW